MTNNIRRWLDILKETDLPMDAVARDERARKLGFTIAAYHGTTAMFDKFDPRRTGDIGIHFGTTEQAGNVVKQHWGTNAGQPNEGAHIMPVRLRIRNPLRVHDAFSTLHSTFVNRAKRWSLQTPGFHMTEDERRALYDAARIADRARRKAGGDYSLALLAHNKHLRDTYESAGRQFWTIIEASAKRQGYDGFVYSNRVEGAGDSYIVFSPSQVRSRFAAFNPAKARSGGLFEHIR